MQRQPVHREKSISDKEAATKRVRISAGETSGFRDARATGGSTREKPHNPSNPKFMHVAYLRNYLFGTDMLLGDTQYQEAVPQIRT